MSIWEYDLEMRKKMSVNIFDEMKVYRKKSNVSGVTAQLTQMNKWQESLSPLRGVTAQLAQMNKWQESLSPLRGVMAQLIQMNKWQEPLTPVRGYVTQLNNSLLNVKGQIDQISQFQKEICLTLNSELLNVTDNGSVVFKDKTFSFKEIEAEVQQTFDAIGMRENLTLELKLARIFQELAKQHPVIAFVMCTILIPFLISIFSSSIMANQPSVNMKQYNKIIVKNIKQNFRWVKVNTYINHFRFVSSNILQVRNGKSMKSKVVGELYLGQVVELIYKNKNWSYIQWTDEMDGTHRGWVFTRYISKFK